MNSTWVGNIYKAAGLLLIGFSLLFLGACGDKEGDIESPSITPNASNAYFTTSDTHILRVDTEIGSEVEVFVSEDVTSSVPVLEGSSADIDTWRFEVSGLIPGGNSIAVTARDEIGNQRTLYLTVTYDFLAIDRVVNPVGSLVDASSSFTIKGTIADSILPTVTIESANLTAVDATVTSDAISGVTSAQRWVAEFVGPLAEDIYTITVTRDDLDPAQTKTYTLTLSDAGYPLASIDDQLFEVIESGLNPEDPANRVDDNVTLAGACLDGATVKLLFNNQEAIAASPCVAGVWSHDVTLIPGKNFITLTVTDDATSLSTTAFDTIWYLLP